ncbi:coenzyme-B sulfoethylthiotransferase subunit beta [Methanosarcina mazei]|uniref:Methyl-coenzyme M reductase subunit beta n=7 Tax=Methanosarcina mazei TaxID=2209 RepID=A0A0F8JJU9_METMZ|nr:coenzyme-B sulfoethylthiotransferase subunit beta [Methanosarcina mazei]AAM30940.1 Methyl-coenzyme M reductase, beta subunit [Methanosarcina mazei Go1]AKB39063.1 Methyl coenzyme M reductase beta subunit [Methanosarcina mazei WWM610]AKB63265.1 Methyl coenzyme M reductase beta subunit [Methanosarcina mazei S-6]AKB66614.1 Methyl coenzyme M reductase beta subunit [Methanosarcina mazei LYC]AKB69958.1 Methyl coenzyme M reductase beta subunit [Methanosarcina mazei C16]
MSDTVDIYDDRGKLLESNVDIMSLAPTRNAAIKKIILDTKRSVAVNLAGIQGALASGKMGGKGRQILGRGLNYDIVGNVDAIAANVKKLVQVDEGDDTNVRVLKGGKSLLIQAPSSRMAAGADFMAATTVGAAAVTQTLIDMFKTDLYDAPIVKSAVWGSYPQTMDLMGGQVQGILSIPQNNEGLGYSLRNIMANHVAAITNRGAMNAAALSSIYEQSGIFEMGGAVGMFERHQLLGLAYQGLNANNMVYDIVKENGKDGTIGTVIESIVGRAIENNVISVDKTAPSGYKFYKANDVPMWNAYAAAGTLASTLVNCGAGRAAQNVSSTLLYFNDIIEKETGLPGCDYGKVQGTAVGFSFFSHSIYGGGGPGVFNGNHVVTRHSRGFAIPCVCAAVALDAGTQMFTIESTSGLIGDVFGSIDEFRQPIKAVAGAL